MRPVRVLIGRPSRIGHRRTARVLASALRSAGVDVVDHTAHQSVAKLAALASRSDVNLIGFATVPGVPRHELSEVLEELAEPGKVDVFVVVTGRISRPDERSMLLAGASAVFDACDSTDDVLDFVRRTEARDRRIVRLPHRPSKTPIDTAVV